MTVDDHWSAHENVHCTGDIPLVLQASQVSLVSRLNFFPALAFFTVHGNTDRHRSNISELCIARLIYEDFCFFFKGPSSSAPLQLPALAFFGESSTVRRSLRCAASNRSGGIASRGMARRTRRQWSCIAIKPCKCARNGMSEHNDNIHFQTKGFCWIQPGLNMISESRKVSCVVDRYSKKIWTGTEVLREISRDLFKRSCSNFRGQ